MNTDTFSFTFTEANQSQENEEKTAKHCAPKRENEEEALHKRFCPQKIAFKGRRQQRAVLPFLKNVGCTNNNVGCT